MEFRLRFTKSERLGSNDMYRFPRLLTAFSSGSRFEFPVALVVKASQERKFLQNLTVSFKTNLFLVSKEESM